IFRKLNSRDEIKFRWPAGQDPPFLFRIIKRSKSANLIEPAHAIQGVEIMGVARRERCRLQIARAQVSIAERVRTLPSEKMKPQPPPARPRNALGFSEESDEQKKDEISIDLRLELKVTSKIFRPDLAGAVFELKCGVEPVIDLFHERDQRPDVAIAQSRTRIVLLELFDQPARIVDSDVKATVSGAQESPRQLAQF